MDNSDTPESASQEYAKVPKEPLVDHLVESAIDVGTVDDLTRPPVKGAQEPLEWDLDSVEDWIIDDKEDTIVLTGTVTGEWTEKTRSSTRWEPAEYQTHEAEVEITIQADFGADPLGEYEIRAVNI